MKSIAIAFNILLISLFSFSQDTGLVNHFMKVSINPAQSELIITDSMVLSSALPSTFQLNSALIPISKTKGMKIVKVEENSKGQDVGMDRDNFDEEQGLQLTKWIIKGNAKNLVIFYQGKIDAQIEQSKANYQRGFSETPGIISQTGIYLAGSTYWLPTFENALVTFTMEVTLPKSWKSVTQGKRILEKNIGEQHVDQWFCEMPQEEAYIIGAQFTEYSYKMNSGYDAMAFLRTPDEALANKYLEVTEQYMDMYQNLVGPYPYTKFALVENFWETGYGMPSFTLLGEKVIRFPFILHSSYPHELLHNWWGNSVYIDFESGNWCEGITAFMADHLIKEQRGEAEEYRRSTLQKYSNLVNAENDFPLNKFISRHDGASEAIGYGKALMMWQMLRLKIGDEMFVKGFQLFYEKNKFKKASFKDIQNAMEEVSGIQLEVFFHQWITRTGAPSLAVKDAKTDMYAGKYRLLITIEQTQSAEAFDIDVPIHIITEKGLEVFNFNMNAKSQEFQISLKGKPLKLAIDPQYDIFRILNPTEVPPTLNKIWGSKENLVVIPSKTTQAQKDIYQRFIEKWKAVDVDNFIVKTDAEVKELPMDMTVWILGYDNKFVASINSQLENYHSAIKSDTIILEKNKIVRKGSASIFTLFNPKDVNQQLIFIGIDDEKAVDGLVRKLPHYGKYSYLAFEGDEPTNIAKGQWPIINSPLTKIFDSKDNNICLIEEREALASLKPVFSENRMMATIKYLASDELKGRGLGTPEIDLASKFIEQKFKEAGLQPMKDSYYQEFTHMFKDKGDLKVVNVIGIIPGSDASLKDEPIVISAHYDHLGLGWPDVHQGDEGKIHYGADDNASGVSILIELANNMGKSAKPKRTIIFLACSAEESGLIGSRYFVAHAKDYFKGNIFANVNLDTDGSLFDKKILILNANTAKEWKFIFMGTDYTTGIKSEIITNDLDASDQLAFIEKGIPAIQVFTGATQNYHRPSDRFEQIDSKGLVKVATVMKEVIEYLADRETEMPFTGANQAENNIEPSTTVEKTNRKVSTGSIPDFAFQGVGVKVGSVVSGSAGEKAGLIAGDIIIKLDDAETPNLKVYSDLLKNYQPDDIVKLTVLRNDVEMLIKLKLGSR